VGRFQRLVYDTGQVTADRIQIHGVFQSRREPGHHLAGIVPGPVEPPVHSQLHPSPQRVEQRRGGQCGGSHRHRAVARQYARIVPGTLPLTAAGA
jgi:hypothetical protein